MSAEATKTAASGTPGHGNKRRRFQDRAIAALLSQPTVEAAAKSTGVSKATLLRWMQDTTFQQAYRAARRQVLDTTIGRLQAVTAAAVAALHEALSCPTQTVRVSAARAVFEFAFRGSELMDLEERLAALEQRFSEKGGDA